MLTIPKLKLPWKYEIHGYLKCGDEVNDLVLICRDDKYRPWVTYRFDSTGACYLGGYWETYDQGMEDLLKRRKASG